MTDQTLTTEEVRQDYMWGAHACGCCAEMKEADAEAFDRWLDKVRAEAQVEALREVAQDAEWSEDAVPGMTAKDVIKGVRARADRIAREAGIETGEEAGA